MPDPDAPSGPRTDADADAGAGGGGADGGDSPHGGGDGGTHGGGDLGTLDPLPRTGTSAPAARQPYATANEPVGVRTGPPPAMDRGPYADTAPVSDTDPHTADPPAADTGRYDPGGDGGPSASEQPPPDGRWSGGSAASDAARAARSARAAQSAQPGSYRPGEPIHRPTSAGTSPGPGAAPAAGRPTGPVGPELQAAARRASRGALLLAIAGVALTIVFFPVGAALDIGAIVLGVRARRLARQARTSGAPGGVAIGLGIPAVLLSLLFAVLTAVFWNEGRAYVSCTSTAITTTTQDQCTAALRTDLQRRVDAWTR